MANVENTAPQPKKRSLEILAERTAKGKASLQTSAADAEKAAAETLAELFLPGFDIGAMPNHLNRSSFIAPIARGTRKFHRQAVLVTRRDCVLEYTGEQLDEADGDLIMALIFFAQTLPLGTLVPLNRKELLRKIKPGKLGSTQYAWLHRSMKRLREATLFLEAKKRDGSTRYSVGKLESFSVLKALSYDDKSEIYAYALDPRWVIMFSNKEYSLPDWDKRMKIGRGLDMAKTLQRLISTSADQVQRFGLEGLKDQMEYGGRIRDFRDALNRATRELERLEIVVKGTIEDSTKGREQLVLRLLPPPDDMASRAVA